MDEKYYLKIGKASDLKNKKERIVYRIFEILPGFLSLTILGGAVFFSYFKPVWVSVFIILFVIFWFFRTLHFSLYLWTSYKKMEKAKKTDWLEKLKSLPPEKYSLPLKTWKEIFHLVVIPMYKEPIEIVRESLNSIKNNDYPAENIFVVLACEKRAEKEIKGYIKKIEEEFKTKFFRFLITWHPEDIPGELKGKGSNETWAAKKAKELLIDPLNIPYENIIFSSFDVDTCAEKKYFSCLTYKYLTTEKPTRTSFQPIPLYLNNVWEAPVISRIFSFSASFWHTMNQERQDKLITFSSHSMSFKALVEAGFKQTNIVPDDSRIFWQCFFTYNGDYKVEPLYYPVSMDINVSKNIWKTILNIYKQQKRWAYGVSDIPYFLFGFLKNKKIPFRKKLRLGKELIAGHISWATVSILIFLLGWLPILLGGNEFSHTLISYNLPKIISRIMTISMICLILSIYLSFALLPSRPLKHNRYKYLIFGIGWFLFPISMIFFASLPALDAQIHLMTGRYLGFWVTEKIRKT